MSNTKFEISNITLKVTPNASSVKEKVADATKRKKAMNETLTEAWERVMKTKAYETKKERFDAVREAMVSGELGRESGSQGKRLSAAEVERLYAVLKERNRERILQEMADNVPDNYWLITDEQRLAEFLVRLDEEEEIVFDVETTGVDVWKDHIVGHVITAIKADIHAYIPTKHITDQAQLPNEYVLKKLRPYYENESIGKLAHNAKLLVL